MTSPSSIAYPFHFQVPVRNWDRGACSGDSLVRTVLRSALGCAHENHMKALCSALSKHLPHSLLGIPQVSLYKFMEEESRRGLRISQALLTLCWQIELAPLVSEAPSQPPDVISSISIPQMRKPMDSKITGPGQNGAVTFQHFPAM